MDRLYLGVARETITPQIGCQLYGYSPHIFADGIEDDLTATAFYFRQEKTEALMISVTVCLIETELANRILGLLEEETGVPRKHCMLCATHTHSGPNTKGNEGWGSIDQAYCETIFIPGILKAASEAKKKACVVKMGMARGNSYVGVNRREFDENNRIRFGQNPWGCMNPQMTVISFRDDAGNTIANMIHYGCHGTAAGQNTRISRDWPGIMTDTLERESGAVTAFFNGPEGDVGPRLSNGKTTGGGDIRYVYELGHAAALDAVRIYKSIPGYHDAPLSAGSEMIHIPLKKRIIREEAEKMLEEYAGHTVNWQGMLRDYAERVLASYENGYEDQNSLSIPQTVIRIGDVAYVSFIYELFSEIGMRIDRMCRDVSVLSLSNTNGSQAYFVTQDQLCRGGYEVTMHQYGNIQPYCDDADWALIQGTVNNVNKIVNHEGGK
ncbi:MAG: hypothetical protein E7329_03240 [Clostridiales bacterium]|nr:hypothetical protein [Clostridiales bacterium]